MKFRSSELSTLILQWCSLASCRSASVSRANLTPVQNRARNNETTTTFRYDVSVVQCQMMTHQAAWQVMMILLRLWWSNQPARCSSRRGSKSGRECQSQYPSSGVSPPSPHISIDCVVLYRKYKYNVCRTACQKNCWQQHHVPPNAPRVHSGRTRRRARGSDGTLYNPRNVSISSHYEGHYYEHCPLLRRGTRMTCGRLFLRLIKSRSTRRLWR